MVGKVKKPKSQIPNVWTGYQLGVSGKKYPRLMTAKEAKKWSLKTGKNIFQSMKVGELREL